MKQKPYPFTQDTCGRLDMKVINSITSDSEDSPIYPIYSIGWDEELAAGIYGGSISPYFKSLEELEAWCISPEGQEIIKKEEANYL